MTIVEPKSVTVLLSWEPIATFEQEPHGQANRVLIAAGDIVGEAWFRDAEGANDTWDSGWWWAGTGPGDYYSSPVIETNDPPRLWMRLPAVPPMAVLAVRNEPSA